MSRAPPRVEDVAAYYQANTGWFLLLGGGGVLHRALWGPGVTTRAQAQDFIHGKLAQALAGARRVLDVGCGVGASAARLARALDAEVVGISLSPAQVARARRRYPRLRFEVADFHALPESLGRFDAAYAVEAYAHAVDAAAFFASLAARLAPGGTLVVVDDVVAPGTSPHDEVLARFRQGWRVPAVRPVDEVVATAARHGLHLAADEDLTPFIRCWRPRDVLVHRLQPLLRLGAPHSPYLSSLVGGDALQVGLSTGRLQHRWLRFVRA